VSPLGPDTICNTTPLRHLALARRVDLLSTVLGGSIRTPRQVFDDEEDPEGPAYQVSELGQSQRYFADRADDGEMAERWGRLLELRARSDIEVIDLNDDELEAYAEVQTGEFAKGAGLAAALGPGEAAVIAIAENRGWAAVLDDAAGRTVLADRAPACEVATTRHVIRLAVTEYELLDSSEAQILYDSLRADGYRGPTSLWTD
jgi:predicted nucleic acid-binding protein